MIKSEKIKKVIVLFTSMAMVFLLSAQPALNASAATTENNNQTSSYTYKGITYDIEKIVLSDGSTQVNVTNISTNEYSQVILSKDKNDAVITQYIRNSNNVYHTTTDNVVIKDASTSSISTDSMSSVVISSLYWGFKSYYYTNSVGFPNQIEWMNTDPDCNPTFLDKWCTIGSTADSLGSDFHQQVLNMKSWQVASVASGGASITGIVAGTVGALATAGVALVIGIAVAAGGGISVGVDMYNAWCAGQAANLDFNKMEALS